MAAIPIASRSISTPVFSLRSFLPIARPSWSTPCEASSSAAPSRVPSSLTLANPPLSTPSWTSLFPSFSLGSLLELIPPIVWASVPKKKTSHGKKSARSANKGLKNRTNISQCPACGSVKLTHHVCPTCYSQISRKWKEEARKQLQLGAQ
ncbi:ribosomal protein L32 [Cryptococcus floricola]|uniref:Large ribosomal subunit protein bL32m n=1 Tax=Cryptococcus floricola TaxID=2591691 RepID=A0A5D3B8L3_9TREE|nr:ribosomal protein L32 [Cryptococcus floricola]